MARRPPVAKREYSRRDQGVAWRISSFGMKMLELVNARERDVGVGVVHHCGSLKIVG